MHRFAVVAALVSTTGCNDAITLELVTDKPIPQAIDVMCLGIADASLHGGQYGHSYRLEGELAMLPQTLRVVPGHASAAWAWVRGDRGGVPVQYGSHAIDFHGDVSIALPKCEKGPASAPHAMGAPIDLANAKLAASHGPNGAVVVAIAAGGAVVIDASGGVLTMTPGPALPAGMPIGVVAADLDGDCDDDIVVVTDGAAPQIWRRDGMTFTPAGTIGKVAVAAIATGDVDRDGRIDVVLGSGSSLQLWLNGGNAVFALDGPKLSGAGRVNAVSALALGDLDGDGNPDLVVGQAGQALAAWLGDRGGGGGFTPNSSIVPPVLIDVEKLTLGDADGDYDPDLAIAVKGAPMKLMIDRGGRLEDQSFVRLPPGIPIAHAIAFGGWDDGCEPDAVIASDAGAATLRGQPTWVFAAAEAAPAASDVVMVDIDDDGDLDAVLATPQGVVWLAR